MSGCRTSLLQYWPNVSRKTVPPRRYTSRLYSALAACGIIFWGASGIMLAGCSPQVPPATTQSEQGGEDGSEYDTRQLSASRPSVFETGSSGAFLAARQALYENDIGAASQFFSVSAEQQIFPAPLLERSFTTHYQNGDLEQASDIARLMERQNIRLPLAAEPAIGIAIAEEDWQAVLALSEKLAEHQANLPLASLLRAYAYFGLDAPEQMYQSLHEFDQINLDSGQGDEAVYQLQRAYFAQLAEQHDTALEQYQRLAEKLPQKSYLIVKIAQGLWFYGETEQAKQILLNALPEAFDSHHIITHWTNNSPARPALQQFIASTLLELSWFSKESLSAGFLLPRVQLALSLDPEYDAAYYVAAISFHALEQQDRAAAYLSSISADSIWYQRRFLLELDMTQNKGDFEQAVQDIDQYQNARAQKPGLPDQRNTERALFAKLKGNFLRYSEQYLQAITAYQQALEFNPSDAVSWRNIGICYEQTEQVEAAEDAFAEALALNPDDAVTLNYLGYWWADENRNLDKAITYIQKAVSLRPRSGYYADSLGWVYYKLGQYDKAVIWLEKAIQLAPTDGIISDHLGDAYWQTGRTSEAQFKWQHAIELGLTPQEQAATHLKLKTGLRP